MLILKLYKNYKLNFSIISIKFELNPKYLILVISNFLKFKFLQIVNKSFSDNKFRFFSCDKNS